jgi:hypothetical protein
MFEVLIETPGRDTRQVRCLHDVCMIGRGEGNLVILQGWNIAREHAALHALRWRSMDCAYRMRMDRCNATMS